MFDPQMMSSFMQNMQNNPDMMRQAQQMMQNNPDMVRQAQQMMQNNPNMMGNQPPNFQQNQQSSNDQEIMNKINVIKNYKQQANDLYRKKEYQQCSSKYLDAIFEIETLREKYISKININQNKELNELEITLRNNFCLAQKNLNLYFCLKDHCERILEIDSKNLKALVNISFYYINNGQDDRAQEYIIQGKQIYPTNENLLSLEKQIQENLQQQNQQKLQETIPEQQIKQQYQTISLKQYYKKTKKQKKKYDIKKSTKFMNEKIQNIKLPQQIKQYKKQENETLLNKNFKFIFGILVGLLLSYWFKK